tara:strand:- start:803 stop:1537 length:735 start_codon:yes stop_codon:yes gene_type:complete
MTNPSTKNTGHVNIFCDEELWTALDNIHKTYGINKSETILSFIKRHFKSEDDLLFSMHDVVEEALLKRLAEVRAAKKKLERPKKPYTIVNINNKVSDFGAKLEQAVSQKADESDQYESPQEEPAPRDWSDVQDINFDNYRYALYKDLHIMGNAFRGSAFLNKEHWSKRWKNGFFKLQAEQAMTMWRDGDTIFDICKKQPIVYTLDDGRQAQRTPTVQTMLKRLIKYITKHGTLTEKAYLYGHQF